MSAVQATYAKETQAAIECGSHGSANNTRFPVSYERFRDKSVLEPGTIRAAEILAEIPVDREKIIYASSTATGVGDGSSWEDAHTSLDVAWQAMILAGEGSQLRTNSTETKPFQTLQVRGSLLPNRCSWLTDQGPDGETWISGANHAEWADEGRGVFSCIPVKPPKHVAFDFQRDDMSGVMTGIDLTNEKYSAALDMWDLKPEDCAAWYGFLVQATVATHIPKKGEWSYKDGRLYINPQGQPDIDAVTLLAIYATDEAGIHFDKSHGPHEYFAITGKLTIFFTPDASPGKGYGIRHDAAKNVLIQGVRTILTGYHAIGMVGASETGNVLKDCVSVGMMPGGGNVGGGSTNPYVFYTHIPDLGDCNHIGTNLAAIAFPAFKQNGQPLMAAFSSVLGFSHTNSKPNVHLDGIEWIRPLMLDFNAQIEARHGIVLSSRKSSIEARNLSKIPDVTDPSTFTIAVRNGLMVGTVCWYRSQVWFDNCVMDRDKAGNKDDLMFAMNDGRVHRILITDGACVTGNMQFGFAYMKKGDAVRFSNLHVLLQMANSQKCSIFHTMQVSENLISLDGTTFNTDSRLPSLLICRHGPGAAVFDEITRVAVNSKGGNMYSDAITKPVRSITTAKLSMQEWLTRVDPKEADGTFPSQRCD